MLRHLTTIDVAMLHGNCMMSYHGNRASLSSPLLSGPNRQKAKRATIKRKLFMWYWLIFCVWCSRCAMEQHNNASIIGESGKTRGKRTILTHTIKRQHTVTGRVFLFISVRNSCLVLKPPRSAIYLKFPFLQPCDSDFLFFLFYL